MRLLKRGLLTLLILASAGLSWDAPELGNPIRLAAQPYQFNLPVWTVNSLTRLWASPAVPSSDQERRILLEDYFTAIRRVLEAQRELQQAQAARDAGAARETEERLVALRQAQDRLALPAEKALAAMVSDFMDAEGIGQRLPLVKPFPPVAFTFQQAPHVLIVSPRDRITLQATILLQQEMDLAALERLENDVSAHGLSGLVERVGGVATFPSLITLRTDLHSALEATAHEWTHHYLFFQPLGQSYWASPEMTTLNESLADLVGRELAEKVAPRSDPSTGESSTPEGKPDAFDVRAVLRETRLHTEELLAGGKIQEAESYMEEQRQLLVDHGVSIRKLNQAYFAFHGTYASSPASISPIDSQLRALRERSASLADFLEKVTRVTRIEELNALVSVEEVTPPRS